MGKSRKKKEPLSWHNECHRNWANNVAMKRSDVARAVVDLERQERELSFYETQIATATSRGMESFDRDRFLVKRTG